MSFIPDRCAVHRSRKDRATEIEAARGSRPYSVYASVPALLMTMFEPRSEGLCHGDRFKRPTIGGWRRSSNEGRNYLLLSESPPGQSLLIAMLMGAPGQPFYRYTCVTPLLVTTLDRWPVAPSSHWWSAFSSVAADRSERHFHSPVAGLGVDKMQG
jgi:hypothetical protein